MTKYGNLKLAAIAAAVAGAFSGDASAALTGTYFGAGATAAQNGIVGAILKSANECGGVASINYFESAATTAAAFSGNQYEITCTNGTGFLAINFDQSGGSWKGLTFFPNLYAAAQADPTSGSPNHVTYINGTAPTCATGPVATVHSYSGVTVNLYMGCPTTLASAAPTFGFTDVETGLFRGTVANQPVLASAISSYFYSPTTWELDTNFVADVSGAEASGFPQGVFAVTFGIAASDLLYRAMQTDQIAAGTLPGCVAGTYSVACAPNITQAQYKSLAAESATNLNLGSIAQLFTNTVPANVQVTLARRDQGSGTQATSNAYFFHSGCGPGLFDTADLLPAIPTDGNALPYLVTYNQTTGSVTTALNSTTANVIGVVSAEKDNGSNSKLTNAGFLKLDGFYPSNTNAALGLYTMVSQEQMHVASGQATGAGSLAADLLASVQTYSNVGIVNTFTHASSWPTLALTGFGGNPSNSYYNNANNNCGGWRSY